MPARPAGRASCTPPATTGKARAYTPTDTLQDVLYPKLQQRPRSAHAAAPSQQRISSATAAAPVQVASGATDLLPLRHPMSSSPPPPVYRSVQVGQGSGAGPSTPEADSGCGKAHTPEPRKPRGVMACQRKPGATPSRPSSANPPSAGERSVGGPPWASRCGVDPPARHAQDDMVVPTLRRGGGPPSGGRACSVVPVGRDSPIGLDLRRFLSAPDPFGQMGGARQPSLTAEQTFAALRAPSGQMQQACAYSSGRGVHRSGGEIGSGDGLGQHVRPFLLPAPACRPATAATAAAPRSPPYHRLSLTLASPSPTPLPTLRADPLEPPRAHPCRGGALGGGRRAARGRARAQPG